MKKRIQCLILVLCATLSLTMTACGTAPDHGGNAGALSDDGTPPFSDIPADAWYADALQDCWERGIFQGTSASTFSPGRTLSRAMLAAILYRMAGSSSLENENLGYPFSDVSPDSAYTDGIYWARLEGVVGGYGNNTFGPSDPVTRQQAVAILWRYAGSPAATNGDFSDSAAISDWASTAAGWALKMGLLTGWADNSFRPQTPLTRAEAAVLLARYLENGGTTSGESNGILVAYFSATGTTRPLAEYAADILNADLYEIVPENPYTSADLDYGNSNSRTTQEQNNPSARPAISGTVENMEQYDTVLLGYPIWHGQSPRIISTFLESYDFSGKTIIPFCTSHSSGIGSSDDNLHSLAPDADWMDGTRFAAGTTREEISAWLDTLNLPETEAESPAPVFNFETHTVMLNSGYEMPIMGLGTYSLSDEECYNSVTALLEAGGGSLTRPTCITTRPPWAGQSGIPMCPGKKFSSSPSSIPANSAMPRPLLTRLWRNWISATLT